MAKRREVTRPQLKESPDSGSRVNNITFIAIISIAIFLGILLLLAIVAIFYYRNQWIKFLEEQKRGSEEHLSEVRNISDEENLSEVINVGP